MKFNTSGTEAGTVIRNQAEAHAEEANASESTQKPVDAKDEGPVAPETKPETKAVDAEKLRQASEKLDRLVGLRHKESHTR